jgi:hypothetical protein
MKRTFSLLLSVLLLTLPSQASSYPSELVELVLEKKVMGRMLVGNRPVLEPASLKQSAFSSREQPSQYRRKTVAQASRAVPMIHKRYQIIQNPETFHSLISVTDLDTGREIRRISVGRRALRLVANPSINRIYVLCGGYFGSLWEIDTLHDVVLRKLGTATATQGVTPLWNPEDMALMPNGHTLAVASGQLRLIDLKTGHVQHQLKLPEESVAVMRMYPLSARKLALISQSRDGKPVYHTFDLAQHQFKPVAFLSPPRIEPTVAWGAVARPRYKLPSVPRSTFVASRNNDFIQMLDLHAMTTVGLLPVDFAVDDLLLTSDRRRLFAYHRRFGQISVIELNPDSPHQFSVIQRIRDQRFLSTPDKPLYLSESVDQVYLWDRYAKIVAAVDRHSLYVRMNLPFAVKLDEKVWHSAPAHTRFYVKAGELFAEHVAGGPGTLPAKIDTGGHLSALVMSPDRRRLYLLQPEQKELVVMDALSRQILKRVPVGKNPSALSVSYRGDRVYVLNADEGTIQVLDAHRLALSASLSLDVGLFQPHILWVYDDALSQLVQIQLPVYLTDVARMVG